MKTIYDEYYTIDQAIDTMQALASGLSSFHPHYPGGRGKSAHPLLMAVMHAAGHIDQAPDGYYTIREDTAARADAAARAIFRKYERCRRIKAMTIVRMY